MKLSLRKVYRVTYSNSLINNLSPLVLDTSVLINLHTSEYGSKILKHLPNEIVIPKIVKLELERDLDKSESERDFIDDLTAAGEARLVDLTRLEYEEVFGKLVSESPSLGDGEAATIAISVGRSYLPVIDERKGRTRARELLSGTEAGWSLDLFLHSSVIAALGMNVVIDALYFALRYGRMRVHEDHCDQIVDLIGVSRALNCPSLPGFKHRSGKWRKLNDP